MPPCIIAPLLFPPWFWQDKTTKGRHLQAFQAGCSSLDMRRHARLAGWCLAAYRTCVLWTSLHKQLIPDIDSYVTMMQDVGEPVRAIWGTVPSIRDLQAQLEAAWRAGFDRSGGGQLSYTAVSKLPLLHLFSPGSHCRPFFLGCHGLCRPALG